MREIHHFIGFFQGRWTFSMVFPNYSQNQVFSSSQMGKEFHRPTYSDRTTDCAHSYELLCWQCRKKTCMLWSIVPLRGNSWWIILLKASYRQPKKFNIRFLVYGTYLSILWSGGSSVCLYWAEKWRVFNFHTRWTQKLVLEQCNEPIVVHIGPCDELASSPRVYPALAHMQLGWDPAPFLWPPKRI